MTAMVLRDPGSQKVQNMSANSTGRILRPLIWSGLAILSMGSVTARAETILFQETFDHVTTGYTNLSCGSGCSHMAQTGVPTNDGRTYIGADNGGINRADQDWRAARFQAGAGSIASDVGVQQIGGTLGGITNNTPLGMFEDDAGLLFNVSTLGYSDITLNFDWRTFNAESNDRITVGYFVGSLPSFDSSRALDLSSGPFSWSQWTQLLSQQGGGVWHMGQTLDLATADNASSVWVAFWMNNGEGDIGKIDNITLSGTSLTPVPVPAAFWLFSSGMAGLAGLRRRRVKAPDASVAG
jgi:hypothetical protein